jgi:hypothetical protein
MTKVSTGFSAALQLRIESSQFPIREIELAQFQQVSFNASASLWWQGNRTCHSRAGRP